MIIYVYKILCISVFVVNILPCFLFYVVTASCCFPPIYFSPLRLLHLCLVSPCVFSFLCCHCQIVVTHVSDSSFPSRIPVFFVFPVFPFVVSYLSYFVGWFSCSLEFCTLLFHISMMCKLGSGFVVFQSAGNTTKQEVDYIRMMD